MHTRRCFCALLLLDSSLWLAYADKWDGTIDNTLDLTTATIDINTSAQLARVAQAAQTDDFAGKTLRLTDDLDLDNRAWTPIGSQAKPFAGTFEGNGHQIANVKVSGSDCGGYLAQPTAEREQIYGKYDSFRGEEEVKHGMSLAQMARKHYGITEFWVYIYEANADRIADPNQLPDGITLMIPRLDTKNAALRERAKRLEQHYKTK